MMHLPILLTVQMFVLISAIFLLVYITKQGVSKWFTYATVSIIIVLLMLMVCSVCCNMCMRHRGMQGMNGECGIEGRCENGKMMMHGMCKHSIKNCEAENDCNETKGCKHASDNEKFISKEITVTVDDDSLPIKKEIIIKKK